MIRLVVYRPEIPQNVGALLRLSACWGIFIDFIGPFPFLFTDKHLKRSGMDYIEKSFFCVYETLKEYQIKNPKETKRYIGMLPKAEFLYTEFSYQKNDVLFLGSEHKGFSTEVEELFDKTVYIPMQENTRSLNMVVSGAVVCAEALRQTCHFVLSTPS